MFSLLQSLFTLSDPHHLFDLDLTLLDDFPLHIFLKDKKGIYQGCTNPLANSLGFSKGCDMLGATDFDMCWSASANDFRVNDLKVMTEEKTNLSIESGTLGNGSQGKALSYKLPLRSKERKIIGVLGVAIEFENNELLSALQFHQLLDSPSIKLQTLKKISTYNLTTRQSECLYHLVMGLSIKQIAIRLSLSARTVEHYLETVKVKLNCYTRCQLIAKVLDE